MSYLSKTLSNIKQELLSHQLENFKATQIEDEAECQKALADRADIMDIWLLGVDSQISNILYELRRKEEEEKTSILSNPKRIVGMVDFTSGEVVVSDPCYKLGTWCQHVLGNVKPGKWIATKKLSHEGEWGVRISQLEAFIDEEPQQKDFQLVEGADIGVDSGQAGFFEKTGYNNTSLIKKSDSQTHSLIQPKDTDPEDKQQQDIFYSVACNLTLSPEQSGVFPGGVVSSSGYGDGRYNLYVRRDAHDNITAMRIVFIEQ